MTVDVLVTVITGVLVVIGVLGTIFPILPGSILVIAGLLLWAIVIGGPIGWTVFGLGLLLCGVGMTASTLLTGKRLKGRQIPNRSILIGAVVGVIVLGAGLYLIWDRLRRAGSLPRWLGGAVLA